MKPIGLLWLCVFAFDSNAIVVAMPSLMESDSAKPQRPCWCYRTEAKKFSGCDYERALANAPILWFAPGEKNFPTMPFFSAGDGVDNNKKDAFDFADPSEIAPLNPKYQRQSLVSWDSLQHWYSRFPEQEKKKLAAVFYRIRPDISAYKLGAILYNDEQFWRRLNRIYPDSSFYRYLTNPSAGFDVFEYYFYYIADEGLQGHPEEIEFIFVFVPQDTNQPFRIVVGAGHTDFVPNNVLVYDVKDNAFKAHMHVLVELHGHSNSPDLNANGRFDPSLDANWHAENLWGTRDVQATTGLGGTGRYETAMTFPREPHGKIFPPDSNQTKEEKSHSCYRLMPVLALKNLDANLTAETGKNNGSLSNATKNLLHDLYGANLEKENQEQRQRLGLWTKNLAAEKAVRPPFWGLWAGIGKYNNLELRLALTIKGIRNYPHGKNNAFEVHAGLEFPASEKKVMVALYHQWSYLKGESESLFARTFSIYNDVSWKNNRSDQSDLALGLGVSLTPPFRYPSGIFDHLRFRIGGRLEFGEHAKVKTLADETRLTFEAQVGLHCSPLVRSRFAIQDAEKHKIWLHRYYEHENGPFLVFKKHLFRPSYFNLGAIAHLDANPKALTEFRLNWFGRPWEYLNLPIKWDGMGELQAGFKFPLKLNRQFLKQNQWILALYYDRYYTQVFSWYMNFGWVNAEEPPKFYLGAGVSLMSALSQKFRYLKLRLGLKSFLHESSWEFDRWRPEIQIVSKLF